MSAFWWIVAGGVAMSAVALVGGLTLLLPAGFLRRLLLPLVAFSAGSLLGGAFFHMLPAALETGAPPARVFAWLAGGFVLFFVLEQFLHWHHCLRADAPCRQPLTYLILIGDGLHNFLGGLAVSATFLVDCSRSLSPGPQGRPTARSPPWTRCGRCTGAIGSPWQAAC